MSTRPLSPSSTNHTPHHRPRGHACLSAGPCCARSDCTPPAPFSAAATPTRKSLSTVTPSGETTRSRPIGRDLVNVLQAISRTTCRGAMGIRTPDLLHAMEARYQLRHSPASRRPVYRNRGTCVPHRDSPRAATRLPAHGVERPRSWPADDGGSRRSSPAWRRRRSPTPRRRPRSEAHGCLRAPPARRARVRWPAPPRRSTGSRTGRENRGRRWARRPGRVRVLPAWQGRR